MDRFVVGQTVNFRVMAGRESEHRLEDIRLVFEGFPRHSKELPLNLQSEVISKFIEILKTPLYTWNIII